MLVKYFRDSVFVFEKNLFLQKYKTMGDKQCLRIEKIILTEKRKAISGG